MLMLSKNLQTACVHKKTIVVKAIRHQINQTSNSQINRTLKTHLSRTTIQMRMPESTQLEYIPILFFAIYERKKNEYINNKYSERNGFRAERLCETHGDFFFQIHITPMLLLIACCY